MKKSKTPDVNSPSFMSEMAHRSRGVLALGGVILAAGGAPNALAANTGHSGHSAAARSEKIVPIPSGPRGVKRLTNPAEINVDYEEAITLMEQHPAEWEGVVVLHKPKEKAMVGYYKSPHAYGSSMGLGGELSVAYGWHNAVVAVKPRIFKYEGRVYLAVFDNGVHGTPSWTFLDVAWAQEVGALSSYAIAGVKAQAKPTNPGGVPFFETPSLDDGLYPLRGLPINGKIALLKPGPVPKI